MAPADAWDAVPAGGTYAPASLDTEGFVHCTGDDATLLVVANAFYRGVPGDMVVLTLDPGRLAAAVRWEAPAHPNPDATPPVGDGPLFPHVYGPLERGAVVLERRLVRLPDGTATGYEPRS